MPGSGSAAIDCSTSSANSGGSGGSSTVVQGRAPRSAAVEWVSAAAINIPATANHVGIRVVTAQLASPVTLNTGEHLFVAVELPAVKQSCIATCQDATVFDRDWWSNAAAPTYDLV